MGVRVPLRAISYYHSLHVARDGLKTNVIKNKIEFYFLLYNKKGDIDKMSVGNWNVKISTNGMPQKVATACAKLNETIVGAEYTPIAYLGSQLVNGTNHAVLAEQLIVTGKDVKNIVVLTFNEKPKEPEATLVSIERVVESGEGFGGTTIDVKVEEDIPSDIITEIWNPALEGRLGAKFRPFAYLGSQMTKGINHIFVVEISSITPDGQDEVALGIINQIDKKVYFADLLANKQESMLGYAFNWLS